MKKINLLCILLVGMFGVKTSTAQMPAAKTIVWDVKISADVKASKGDVWRVLIDNEKLQQYSNGYVKSVTTIDQELVESRDVVFTNGNTRTETFAQTDYVNKFMVIRINKISLPKGIKSAEIAIFTKDLDDDGSNILWVAKITGRKSAKQKLMNQLEDEFNAYAKGFTKIKS